MKTAFGLMVVLLALLLAFGDGYLTRSCFGVLQAVFTGAIAVLGSLLVRQVDSKRDVRRKVAELQNGVEKFSRWLQKRTGHYGVRRSEIAQNLIDRHLLSSTIYSSEVASAFLDYVRDVEEHWSQEVEDLKRVLLADVQATGLLECSPAAAKAYQDAHDGMTRLLQKERDETESVVARSGSPQLSKMFAGFISKQDFEWMKS